jgi:RelB antitoxin
MPADTVVRARIDAATKERASAALEAMGLSISDAIGAVDLRRHPPPDAAYRRRSNGCPSRSRSQTRPRAGPWPSWSGGRVNGSTPPKLCSRTWTSEVRVAVRSGQFRRDVRRAQKRGKNLSQLRELILLLLEQMTCRSGLFEEAHFRVSPASDSRRICSTAGMLVRRRK